MAKEGGWGNEMDRMRIMETAEKYTYRTYADLSDANTDTRYEVIDGDVYYMEASGASQAHQKISGELFFQLKKFLDGKPCQIFHAPFDVCLNAQGDDDRTTVQPDILVVCDESKLDGKRCNGAPDLIIEILSPSNSRYDKLIKFNTYRRAGVREYWIVDPEDTTTSVHVLEDGKYVVSVYGIVDPNDKPMPLNAFIGDKSIVPVHVLDGCEIDLKKVF